MSNVIIAGPSGQATGTAPNDFRLYTWSGLPAAAPVLRTADLTALGTAGSFEGIVEVPAALGTSSVVQLLVDEGDTVWYGDGVLSRELPDREFQKSRSDLVVLGAATPVGPVAGTVPVPGDVIINEYASDNDAVGNDFIELLVLGNGVDLRGLRVSDNELVGGVLNNNEAVMVFGTDAFLANVPRGTLITLWTTTAGVVTDTGVNPATGDWRMDLAPGTGFTMGVDGLGGSVNAGLANGGEAIYLYLPGPDGTSAGTDNIYLDFVSFETDGGEPPAGMVDLNLTAEADNAYYVGSTAAGNDLVANWVKSAALGAHTPGEPNPNQDLSALRALPNVPGVTVTQTNGSTLVAEGGATDTYTLTLGTPPAGPVQVQITTDGQVGVSSDGVTFSSSLLVSLSTTTPFVVTVQAANDTVSEAPLTSTITQAIVASADPLYSNSLTPVSSVPVAVTDDDVATVALHAIQGATGISPLAGSNVITRGIVTALKSNGFFLQQPDATVDALDTTSEGIFVFTGVAPALARGDDVLVSGTVSEFIPTADPVQLPLTEIVNPTISVLSSGNSLPAPVIITAAMASAPNAVELLERLEGMRVSVPSLTVVGPTGGNVSETTATSSSNGLFFAVVTGVSRPFREPGIDALDPLPAGLLCCLPRFDGNPERLRVDSDAQPGAPTLDVAAGTIVTGLVGPLDYGFRTYTVLPDAGSASVGAPVAFTAVPATVDGEISIAGFNLERFFDTTNDPAIGEPVLTAAAFENRLKKASLMFRQVLRLPDVVGVVEVENLSTLQTLAGRINTDSLASGLGDPGYVAYLIEGNDIGGIDVGFLVRSSRVTVVQARQEGKDETYVDPNTGLAATLNDRPPLVLDARAVRSDGSVFDFTVIVNHLRSLIDIGDATDGHRVRVKRRAQAEFLASLIQSLQVAGKRVLAIGDFNAFEVNDGFVDVIGTIRGAPAPADQVVLPSADLVTTDLVSLLERLPASQRYSYVFDGNAQVLDHALASASLSPWISRFAYSRSNSDFPESARNDNTRPERLSDHDASVTYLAVGLARISGKVLSAGPRAATGEVVVTLQVSNTGGGNALNLVLDQMQLRALTGSGAVTLVTPLPIAVGTLGAGESRTVTVTVNLPAAVTRFSITENGAFQTPDGVAYRFSMAQAVIR